jgi:hypothetical protein
MTERQKVGVADNPRDNPEVHFGTVLDFLLTALNFFETSLNFFLTALNFPSSLFDKHSILMLETVKQRQTHSNQYFAHKFSRSFASFDRSLCLCLFPPSLLIPWSVSFVGSVSVFQSMRLVFLTPDWALLIPDGNSVLLSAEAEKFPKAEEWINRRFCPFLFVIFPPSTWPHHPIASEFRNKFINEPLSGIHSQSERFDDWANRYRSTVTWLEFTFFKGELPIKLLQSLRAWWQFSRWSSDCKVTLIEFNCHDWETVKLADDWYCFKRGTFPIIQNDRNCLNIHEPLILCRFRDGPVIAIHEAKRDHNRIPCPFHCKKRNTVHLTEGNGDSSWNIHGWGSESNATISSFYTLQLIQILMIREIIIITAQNDTQITEFAILIQNSTMHRRSMLSKSFQSISQISRFRTSQILSASTVILHCSFFFMANIQSTFTHVPRGFERPRKRGRNEEIEQSTFYRESCACFWVIY